VKPGQYNILPGVLPYDPGKEQTIKELDGIMRQAREIASQKPANPFA